MTKVFLQDLNYVTQNLDKKLNVLGRDSGHCPGDLGRTERHGLVHRQGVRHRQGHLNGEDDGKPQRRRRQRRRKATATAKTTESHSDEDDGSRRQGQIWWPLVILIYLIKCAEKIQTCDL
jgi:hypothetical protein